MGALKKVERRSGAPGGAGRVADDPWLSGTFPTLWQYLSQEVWEDGTVRTTSTMTMFVEHGMVKVCLSDRDAERSAWSSGDTLEEAVLRLEQALADDRAEWRFKPPEGRKAGPRR